MTGNKRYDPHNHEYGIDNYPDKEPDRYLNDFFNVQDFTEYLTNIMTQLYHNYMEYHMDQLWEPLIYSFHFHEREWFSKDLREYIFSIIGNEIKTNGKRGREKIKVPKVRKLYISMAVEFLKLFLRSHLIRQDWFQTKEEYEKAVSEKFGYFFMDVACHEFAVGKTFPLSGRIKIFEQNTINIYWVQDAIMGMEDDNGEEFDFEVSKGNYIRFKRKLERIMGDKIFFEFMVTEIKGPNYVHGKILSFE
jgi:hypothetical protein